MPPAPPQLHYGTAHPLPSRSKSLLAHSAILLILVLLGFAKFVVEYAQQTKGYSRQILCAAYSIAMLPLLTVLALQAWTIAGHARVPALFAGALSLAIGLALLALGLSSLTFPDPPVAALFFFLVAGGMLNLRWAQRLNRRTRPRRSLTPDAPPSHPGASSNTA